MNREVVFGRSIVQMIKILIPSLVSAFTCFGCGSESSSRPDTPRAEGIEPTEQVDTTIALVESRLVRDSVSESSIEVDSIVSTETNEATGPELEKIMRCDQEIELAMLSGKELFEGFGNCKTCHGEEGAGSPLGPAIATDEWISIDGSFESIVANIREGVSFPKKYPTPMPAMGGAILNEQEICQLASYVESIRQK